MKVLFLAGALAALPGLASGQEASIAADFEPSFEEPVRIPRSADIIVIIGVQEMPLAYESVASREVPRVEVRQEEGMGGDRSTITRIRLFDAGGIEVRYRNTDVQYRTGQGFGSTEHDLDGPEFSLLRW